MSNVFFYGVKQYSPKSYVDALHLFVHPSPVYASEA